ncbi:MAG: hypothetical protein M3O55_11615 [Actinomycetota bacterium]|nr:hypothetical protein [Actinomycetota bacterium]
MDRTREARERDYVVAVNCFDGIAQHELNDVRDTLGIPAAVPAFHTDARLREANKQAMLAVIRLAMTQPAGASA